jgi:hypothetical protein
MAKAVVTPDGRFASLHLAATYYDISSQTVLRRIRSGRQGWEGGAVDRH